MRLQVAQDVRLQLLHLAGGQRVRLADHQHHVDLLVQPAQHIDVHLPQAVPVRRQEVQAAVHAVVLDVPPVQPALVGEVLTELKIAFVLFSGADRRHGPNYLLVDVADARTPALLAVDAVAEAGRVDDRQAQPDAPLLDVHRLLLDARRALHALGRARNGAALVQIAEK